MPDRAARTAADAAAQVLAAALVDTDARVENPDGYAVEATRAAVAGAQDAVHRIGWTPEGDLGAPSCTFVSAVWDGREITVGSVGDSRAYWIDAESAQRLTVDDSWAQEQVAAGLMTEAAIDADPRAHAITHWIGADAPADPPTITSFRPDRPGRLIVCTDGLWNYLPGADALAAVVRAHPVDADAIDIVRSLVDTAISRGGHDNVTVVVIDIASRGHPHRPWRNRDHVQHRDLSQRVPARGRRRNTRHRDCDRVGLRDECGRDQATDRGRDHHHRRLFVDGPSASWRPPSKPPRPRSTAFVTGSSSAWSPVTSEAYCIYPT